MAYIPPTFGTSFLCNINAAQGAVRAGTTQYVRQKRLYRQWDDFCATLLVNLSLKYPSIPCINPLQVYGHRVWHSKCSKYWMGRLGRESFSQSWGTIATSHLLDGLPDPRKSSDSQSHTRLNKWRPQTYQERPTSQRGGWVISTTLPEKNFAEELFYGFPRNAFPRNAFPQK